MIIDFEERRIDPKDRQQIAWIVKDAFWEKMAWFFGKVTEEEAGNLLMESITYDKGFYYKDDDRVLGSVLLSDKEVQHLQFEGSAQKKMGHFRVVLMNLFFGINTRKKDVLVLQMIAVSQEARGRGIGKRLLSHLYAYATCRGYKAIVLDVIDSNHGAKSLYEREGFKVERYHRTKFLTRDMGFDGVYVMRKRLSGKDIVV